METPTEPREGGDQERAPSGDASGDARGDARGPGSVEEPTQEERRWALLAHLLALFTGPLAPLVIWLVQKDDSPFVRDHAHEALNFQVTVALASLAAGMLLCVGVGLVLLALVALADLVLVIVATLRAAEGEAFRYPISLRLVPEDLA